MDSETARVSILRFVELASSQIEDTVVREFSLTITVNDQELVTLLCSPANLEYLVAGFILSQGLIKVKSDIKHIAVDEGKGIAIVKLSKAVQLARHPVIASGGGRDIAFAQAQPVTTVPQLKLSVSKVFSLMEDFVHRSTVFKATGGVHSAALCDINEIVVFTEDIGRHNAIDKIFGECVLRDIPLDGKFVITSGRVSSEILLKIAKRNIPLLISKSAPTDVGTTLAQDLGITLVGFVRDKKMNIYANDWRIVADGK